MNGYTADQPITQIFPTLMSMLLFAFASWMIPKMAASIASGTLGAGAADLVGMGAGDWQSGCARRGDGRRCCGNRGRGRRRGRRSRSNRNGGCSRRGEARRQRSGLAPLPVVWVKRQWKHQRASAAGSGSGSGWFSQPPPPPPPPPSAAESPASAPSAPPAPPSSAR